MAVIAAGDLRQVATAFDDSIAMIVRHGRR